ncbi:AMP-binding protein [Escherichia albertii]|nr:AMP-binding protein [Escherichia albertii]
MSIPFTRWPEEFARRYREKGYWQDLPLTDILTRHAASDSIAVIDGERQLSYRQLNQAANNLACHLRRQGIKSGETALVQLGNVAELYITFFALLKLGVAPVLALFSHQRSELNAYASQIEPALLIADRQHALFSGNDFLNTFVAEHSSIRVVQLHNDSGEHNLQDAINHPAEDFTATPSPADEVSYFQLSGGTTGTPKLIPRTHNDYYYSVRRSVEICQFTQQTRYPMCPDDEVWVADADGNPLPQGEVGRLMTRGPYTFRGYYKSPQHNASAFDANGFYCSGDLISIDPDGYITVQGREKDQINRGGEKIAAEEIENLLLRHPAVIYAALVSMEDELMGEKSCAYLVVKEPLRAVQVRRFLREQGIAEFKLPDRVECVDSLPLTAVGKVDKKQLRQWLASRAPA